MERKTREEKEFSRRAAGRTDFKLEKSRGLDAVAAAVSIVLALAVWLFI